MCSKVRGSHRSRLLDSIEIRMPRQLPGGLEVFGRIRPGPGRWRRRRAARPPGCASAACRAASICSCMSCSTSTARASAAAARAASASSAASSAVRWRAAWQGAPGWRPRCVPGRGRPARPPGRACARRRRRPAAPGRPRRRARATARAVRRAAILTLLGQDEAGPGPQPGRVRMAKRARAGAPAGATVRRQRRGSLGGCDRRVLEPR